MYCGMSTYVCRGVTVQYGSELVSEVTENRVADGDGGVVQKMVQCAPESVV